MYVQFRLVINIILTIIRRCDVNEVSKYFNWNVHTYYKISPV